MLLIKPFLGCNLACKYCYEGTYRKKTKPKMNYNLEAILKRMEEFKDLEMTLHGGEPLAMPKKDVDRILGKMVELTGKSYIQTNGTLIDDEYVEIFKRYKTGVGISWDGPGELSEFRTGSARVGKIIEKLVKEGITVSMILVISKANAGTDERLKKLKDYLLELEKMKISGRINPCAGTPDYELDEKRIREVYLDLAQFCIQKNLKWSPFIDIVYGLQDKDRVCTFMGCDYFHTLSATVILGDGSITNCMRTNQEYVLLRHPIKYDTRSEILSEIPQEFGGCQGCKYWTACYGGCPTSAINDDWRNRTYLCSLWKALFQYFENVLRFVEYPAILPQTEAASVSQGVESLNHQDGSHGDYPHGDGHGDSPHGDGHGDSPHGDGFHGDSVHGDGHADSG